MFEKLRTELITLLFKVYKKKKSKPKYFLLLLIILYLKINYVMVFRQY